MKGEAHLVRRGPAYYFRARVPADLLTQFPTREIRVSLRTSDKDEARQLARVEREKWEATFAAQRRSLNPEQQSEVTEEEIKRLVAYHIAMLLRADDETRLNGDLSGLDQDLAYSETEVRDLLARAEFPACLFPCALGIVSFHLACMRLPVAPS